MRGLVVLLDRVDFSLISFRMNYDFFLKNREEIASACKYIILNVVKTNKKPFHFRRLDMLFLSFRVLHNVLDKKRTCDNVYYVGLSSFHNFFIFAHPPFFFFLQQTSLFTLFNGNVK